MRQGISIQVRPVVPDSVAYRKSTGGQTIYGQLRNLDAGLWFFPADEQGIVYDVSYCRKLNSFALNVAEAVNVYIEKRLFSLQTDDSDLAKDLIRELERRIGKELSNRSLMDIWRLFFEVVDKNFVLNTRINYSDLISVWASIWYRSEAERRTFEAMSQEVLNQPLTVAVRKFDEPTPWVQTDDRASSGMGHFGGVLILCLKGALPKVQELVDEVAMLNCPYAVRVRPNKEAFIFWSRDNDVSTLKRKALEAIRNSSPVLGRILAQEGITEKDVKYVDKQLNYRLW